MTSPRFSQNSLVEYSNKIYEVLNNELSDKGYKYTLKLRAFLTNEDVSIDYVSKHIFSLNNIDEKQLKEFNSTFPRYQFEERVRWTDSRHETYYSIVKYIYFENHRYMYRLLEESRKDEGYWMNYGHLIEESYISK